MVRTEDFQVDLYCRYLISIIIGIIVLLCIISYNRYISHYTVDSTVYTLMQHEAIKSSMSKFKEDYASYRHPYMHSEDFFRRISTPDEYFRFVLLKEKMKAVGKVRDTLSLYKETKLMDYFRDLLEKEILLIIGGHFDSTGPFFVFWTFFGLFFHILKLSLWDRYLREMLKDLIRIENTYSLKNIGISAEISSDLLQLKLFKLINPNSQTTSIQVLSGIEENEDGNIS